MTYSLQYFILCSFQTNFLPPIEIHNNVPVFTDVANTAHALSIAKSASINDMTTIISHGQVFNILHAKVELSSIVYISGTKVST